jgi:hypothetical protein
MADHRDRGPIPQISLITSKRPSSAAFLKQGNIHFEITVSRTLVLGLVALLALLNTYLLTKRLEIRRVRGELISRTIQQELIQQHAMQTIKAAGIENVRQYLAHKSIASTGAYLRVTDADASSAVTAAVRPAAQLET